MYMFKLYMQVLMLICFLNFSLINIFIQRYNTVQVFSLHVATTGFYPQYSEFMSPSQVIPEHRIGNKLWAQLDVPKSLPPILLLLT